MSVLPKSKISMQQVAQDMVKGLYDSGIIEATSLREFNLLLKPPVRNLKPSEIKRIRLREKVSQAALASILNTTLITIRKWENGETIPKGISLKLLNLVADKGLDALM